MPSNDHAPPSVGLAWRGRIHEARHWISFLGPRRLAGGIASAAFVVVTAWLLFRPAGEPVESGMLPATAITTVPGATWSQRGASALPPIKVHVAGAVRRPGVYSLAVGSRVDDAVRAAGGPTGAADLERINLAQIIIDTEQVYVPSRKSAAPRVTVAPRLRPSRATSPRADGSGASTSPTTTTPSRPGGASAGASRKVDLNSATAAQLEELPGIGPATARAIVTHRTRKGPFAKVDDLLNVPGIGPSKLAAIRDLVSV